MEYPYHRVTMKGTTLMNISKGRKLRFRCCYNARNIKPGSLINLFPQTYRTKLSDFSTLFFFSRLYFYASTGICGSGLGVFGGTDRLIPINLSKAFSQGPIISLFILNFFFTSSS